MRRRRMLLVAFAAVAALAVAGAVAANPGARQAASGKQKLAFQLSFFANAQHVGYLVAAHRGYYGQVGLNFSLKPGGPTVEPTLLVAQGQVDIAQVDFTEFVDAVSKGAPLTYIGMTYQQDPLSYLSLKSTPLNSPADLKGKTIGQQQAGEIEPELKELLDKAHLSVNDVKIVPIGFTIDDLLSGKCQVFPSRLYFHPAEFEDKGIHYPDGLNILDSNKLGVAIPSQGLAVNNSYLKAHRGAVIAFLRASLKGWYQAIGNPRAAVADVEAYIPKGASNAQDDFIDIKTTTGMVTHSANGKPYKKILALDMPYLEQGQKTLLKYGVIKKTINLSQHIDMSLLDQARAKPLK